MPGFEEAVRRYLSENHMAFIDTTGSLDALDFQLTDHDIHFDLKEKKQHFNMRNWPGTDIPEEHLFILDDLAARKILLRSPRSFLLIRDCTRESIYIVYTVVDLLCMPKRRVRRKLEKSVKSHKGKWYIDLRHGSEFHSLADAIAFMSRFPERFPDVFSGYIDCWGRYEGEEMLDAGTPRKSHHWTKDLNSR